MGLQTDLKLRGDNYHWLGSMFYFVCCSELLGSIVSFAKSLFLLGLSCMGVSDKQTPATSAISEILIIQCYNVGFDSLLHGRYQ
jgi:hypothetical protein